VEILEKFLDQINNPPRRMITRIFNVKALIAINNGTKKLRKRNSV